MWLLSFCSNCSMVRWILWIWDYIYAYTMILKWILTRELLTPHLPLNLLRECPARKGQVGVLTGGTRGIGAAVLKKLLQMDMRVIVGCRDPSQGEALMTKLRASGVSTGSVDFLPLDLASFESVRTFASNLIAMKLQINILINNAGVMAVPYKLTVDSLESHFQINYLSHFLLINLLLPSMKAAAEVSGVTGRIVNVSSSAQYDRKVDFGDLELRSRYNPFLAYFNSKWMQVVMTRFLDRQLQAEGARVRVNSLHPGVVGTDLVAHLEYVGTSIVWLTKRLLMTPDQGGDEVAFVALSSEAEGKGGEYFVHRRACLLANDTPRIQSKLWEVSCHLTRVQNQYS